MPKRIQELFRQILRFICVPIRRKKIIPIKRLYQPGSGEAHHDPQAIATHDMHAHVTLGQGSNIANSQPHAFGISDRTGSPAQQTECVSRGERIVLGRHNFLLGRSHFPKTAELGTNVQFMPGR